MFVFDKPIEGFKVNDRSKPSRFFGTQKNEQINPANPSVIFSTALFSKRLQISELQTDCISPVIKTSRGVELCDGSDKKFILRSVATVSKTQRSSVTIDQWLANKLNLAPTLPLLGRGKDNELAIWLDDNSYLLGLGNHKNIYFTAITYKM